MISRLFDVVNPESPFKAPEIKGSKLLGGFPITGVIKETCGGRLRSFAQLFHAGGTFRGGTWKESRPAHLCLLNRKQQTSSSLSGGNNGDVFSFLQRQKKAGHEGLGMTLCFRRSSTAPSSDG